MFGPFLDVMHAKLDELEMSFEDVFKAKILAPLEKMVRDAGGTTVVLVPSSKDAFHDPVFPQEAFEGESVGQGIVMAPNPCTIAVNGAAAFAVSSTDIIKHLAGTEISRTKNADADAATQHISDRMSRLCAHLVGQRSFYPLYPPNAGTMLDCNLALPEDVAAEETTRRSASSVSMGVLPHIMIMPSDLGVFAKRFIVRKSSQDCGGGGAKAKAKGHSIVGVNPGRLTRGVGGGTYALLKVPCPGRAMDVDIASGTSAHVLKI